MHRIPSHRLPRPKVYSGAQKAARKGASLTGISPKAQIGRQEALDELMELSESPLEKTLLREVKGSSYNTQRARAAAYQATFNLLAQSGSHVGNAPFVLTEKRLAAAGLSTLEGSQLLHGNEDAAAPFLRTISSETQNPTTKRLVQASLEPEHGMLRAATMNAALTIMAGGSRDVTTKDSPPEVLLEAAEIAHNRGIWSEEAADTFLFAREESMKPI